MRVNKSTNLLPTGVKEILQLHNVDVLQLPHYLELPVLKRHVESWTHTELRYDCKLRLVLLRPIYLYMIVNLASGSAVHS